MVISNEDLIEYIEDAPVKKVKQLAMVMGKILDPNQLNALDKRFKKKIDFEPVTVKTEQPKKRTPKQKVQEEMDRPGTPIPPLVDEEEERDEEDFDLGLD